MKFIEKRIFISTDEYYQSLNKQWRWLDSIYECGFVWQFVVAALCVAWFFEWQNQAAILAAGALCVCAAIFVLISAVANRMGNPYASHPTNFPWHRDRLQEIVQRMKEVRHANAATTAQK